MCTLRSFFLIANADSRVVGFQRTWGETGNRTVSDLPRAMGEEKQKKSQEKETLWICDSDMRIRGAPASKWIITYLQCTVCRWLTI